MCVNRNVIVIGQAASGMGEVGNSVFRVPTARWRLQYCVGGRRCRLLVGMPVLRACSHCVVGVIIGNDGVVGFFLVEK